MREPLLADQLEARMKLHPAAYQAYLRGIAFNLACGIERDPLEEMRKTQRKLQVSVDSMIAMHRRRGTFKWIREIRPGTFIMAD